MSAWTCGGGYRPGKEPSTPFVNGPVEVRIPRRPGSGHSPGLFIPKDGRRHPIAVSQCRAYRSLLPIGQMPRQSSSIATWLRDRARSPMGIAHSVSEVFCLIGRSHQFHAREREGTVDITDSPNAGDRSGTLVIFASVLDGMPVVIVALCEGQVGAIPAASEC